MHGLFPGQHAVDIAPDGVDLSVVHDIAIGMCPFPARIGIGRKTRMHHRHGALAVRILQIAVECPQLMNKEHALVDDGPAGEGRDIRPDVALFELPADDIEQPVEIQPLRHLGGAPHEALHDAGLRFPRGLAKHLRTYRHLSPAEEFHTVARNNDLQHLLRLQTLQRFLRQEEHPEAVASGRAQIINPDLPGCLHHQPVRDLHHQPDTVSGLAAGVLPCAMLQLLHNLQRVVHGTVALLAPDADDSSDPAGIMLHRRAVQRIVLFRQHGTSSSFCLFDLRTDPNRKGPPTSAAGSPFSKF